MNWDRHRHVWKIVETREQASVIDMFAAVGQVINASGAHASDLRTLARHPVIVKRRCEACGTEDVYRV